MNIRAQAKLCFLRAAKLWTHSLLRLQRENSGQ
jgi:hypothetical protein